MRLALGLVLALASSLAACEGRLYPIGAQCGPTSTDPRCGSGADAGTDAGADGSACVGDGGCVGVTLQLPLVQSGTLSTTRELRIGGTFASATISLRADRATGTTWTSEEGFVLGASAGTAPSTGRPAPFTDGSHVVELAAGAGTYTASDTSLGDASREDLVVEAVFRASPSSTLVHKQDATAGYRFDVDGTLGLGLSVKDANGATLRIAGPTLVDGAFYHCLGFVGRSASGDAGGRILCNGRAGSAVDVHALASLSSSAPLRVGGDASTASAATALAYAAVYTGDGLFVGASDAAAAMATAARLRFARLVGVEPSAALGTPLPRLDVRASAATLDLLDQGVRRLFLVGEDWPRIACRPDGLGSRFCGYLGEATSDRAFPGATEATGWSATALGVTADQALDGYGLATLDALVPTAAATSHELSNSRAYGGQRLAFSFFVRAGSKSVVGATDSSSGVALYDLAAGAVASAPSGVTAALESYGNGLFRCVYASSPPSGTVTHRVLALADAGGGTWAGDGSTVSHFVGGLEVEIGEPYPTSPMRAGARAPDRLTYEAGDGNLPSGTIRFEADVLLPDAPRSVDQTFVNVNRAGSFDDEVGFFLSVPSESVALSARVSGMGSFGTSHTTRIGDGRWHPVAAAFRPGLAETSVDGLVQSYVPPASASLPTGLDRIDVGHSIAASGPVNGLVRYVTIRSNPP